MRYIQKGTEPISFTQWKQQNPGARYKNLEGAIKQELKQSLIDEQKSLCCYCERRIISENSHIEHFKPKGNDKYRHLELDYNNLHASCFRFNPKEEELRQCGHRKGRQISKTLLSPLDKNCSTHFSYTLDGKIHGIDSKGKEAIEVYNLNSALLIKSRKQLIDFFLEDDVTEQDIIDHIDTTQNPLGEFITMITYLYDNGDI